MKAVGITEARTRLSSLVSAVERGETIAITRHGKPVAKLVPVGSETTSVAEAIQAIRESRKGWRLNGLTTRELIDEGRKLDSQSEDEMKDVGIYEAKTKLPSLINEVERGETITITRHGKPVAKLVPVEGAGSNIAEVIRATREFRKGRSLGGISIKELIEEGRKD